MPKGPQGKMVEGKSIRGIARLVDVSPGPSFATLE